MTLTEQWKKGELEAGWYYVLLFSNEEYITFIDGNWVVDDRLIGADIKEVLAPVPSYEEWQQLHKFLEEFNALDVAKENQQLKELLYSLKCCLTSQNIDPQIRVEKSLAKINNAIGEK